MTNRRTNKTIIISDSDEEYNPAPKKKVVTKKKPKVLKISDSEGESKKVKPRASKKARETTGKPLSDEIKVSSSETVKKSRKRKSEESIEMGGLFSQTTKSSESKRVRTQEFLAGSQVYPRSVYPTLGRPQEQPIVGRRLISPTRSQPSFHEPPKKYTSCEWTDVDYIEVQHGISRSLAQILVQFFVADNTVPFIARYRKAATGGLEADELRLIKESFDRVKLIQHKADVVIKAIEKVNKWTPEIHRTVKSIRSLNELEHIHSLYKTTKKSLAERARDLGLEPTAILVLRGGAIPHLASFINISKEGLQNEEQIKEGIVCIIADIINKDKRVFDKINDLRSEISIQIQTKKTKTSDEADAKADDKAIKYDMYYDWNSSEKNIKPHQTLAINRAESQKIITVKLIIPDYFEVSMRKFVLDLYGFALRASALHAQLINEAFNHACKKSMKPSVARRVRSEMNEKAEEASMEVFATNVKQLLLASPVRGKVVLGIDPGFAHGCKLAVVSQQGDVLETATIYPHRKDGRGRQEAIAKLSSLVRKHRCDVIALGNATACRETEIFLSDIVKSGVFAPLDVTYTIVDEAGASIYSCGAEAKAEFPKLDCNVISAISIARRLQDPLAELVKIEPKHLGVGMYQHDLPEKQLMTKLNEVVMEAASFVGVDVNTASQCLLRRVAGLSETKAANIIEWRRENGPFVNRNQLMKVKGIGAKTFEQCAGFIRIQPETSVSKMSGGSNLIGFNYLDQTWIHPESYSVSNSLINDCGLDAKNIGSRPFIIAIKNYALRGYEFLTKKLKTDDTTLEIIIKGLTMARDEDIRSQNNAPLFRKSLRSIDDLVIGSLLSGKVRNVTHFGAFVDVGVGKDGLIHVSQLKGETLKIGQRVDVKVQNIVKERGRIGLILITSY
ncbi:S1 RNA-binding domain-containing protein 1-like [Fopius arisanus]|uniref:S1 RNA-binding domain-containing protein 1-like n=1 Tax=Fopius arisanus TaxID=64838 RepID=A0A9R1TG85_9HYME|nr:PREDICTED: S1 RNA-binding domain-containing protein 1-like [Fopius arisanus]XP_011308754.1 PREDICTED: S1 RNA-binding domain-containing protein 1-like [Fopius arisanus]